MSQLVLGAGQFFTAAFLATDLPPWRVVMAQLAVWEWGRLLVAVGAPTGSAPLVEAGAALIGSDTDDAGHAPCSPVGSA